MLCPKSVQTFGHISDIWQVSKICLNCVQNVSKNMSKICTILRHFQTLHVNGGPNYFCRWCVQKMSKMCPNLWTHFRHLLDTFWTFFRKISVDQEVSKKCPKYDLVWTQFGHNRLTWTYIGHISDTIWTWFGHIAVMDTFWTYFGHIFDTFWTLF